MYHSSVSVCVPNDDDDDEGWTTTTTTTTDARSSTRTDPSAACDDGDIEIENQIQSTKISLMKRTSAGKKGDPFGRFLNHNPWDLDQD